MSIGRTAWTDDDGTGTTGTVIDNAEKTELYDQIDALKSRVTLTLTGVQNNVSITASSKEADVVLLNNASALTISGIVAPTAPPKPGKRLVLFSIGAGDVFLLHQNGSSVAANRLINFATSGQTPLAAGVGVATYVYDDNASRWRLEKHEQGAPITPTFADSHYTGAGVDANWTLVAGDRTTQEYWLKGRRLFVSFYLATTSVAGTPANLRITNAAWGSFTSAKTKLRPIVVSDNGGANAAGFAQVSAGGTEIIVSKMDATAFANAANTTGAFGDIDFEVA